MIAGGWQHSWSVRQLSSNFTWAAAVFLTFAIQFGGTSASDRTLSGLIQQHLDSIGSPEALAGVRFRVAEGIGKGTGNVLKQMGHSSDSIYGGAQFSAGPDSLRFTIQCDSPRYPVEGFFFDNGRVKVAVLDRQDRSLLGEFLTECEEYVKEGLFGGVLSTIWPLLEAQVAQRKLKSKGVEDLDGQNLLAFGYSLGGKESVVLYFDPKTSRHVATKCTEEMREGYWTLIETFDDVRTFEGLNLPSNWTLALHAPRVTLKWNVTFEKITHADGPILKRPSRPDQ